ncbi:indolepyruvate ferredoxin oxidoreductase subunit alpha [Streptomyces odontomachi]|uniref:indolepyruvate ferredoxin oxidoreductase subunit alpha n=1 Tax=Streptomyces odontomachi TaxID=2944940 RepID=UPI00210E9087|nr:4Fe-4S binding protein [Streptomyces sp. ODS25]
MSYVITEPCVDIKDGACVDVCPVDCIEGTDADRQLYIDPERCVDCDLCLTVCPVDAIYKEEEVPEEWQGFIEVNRKYFADQQPG